jgi:4-amino-4-deoxy-L-arabinose transferase-like glycosyltransferase
LALAIRLPWFTVVPRFTDEVGEVMHSLAILRGDLLVLTNVNGYNGSLWNWLVAAILLVTGNSLLAPRALVLAFGVATVLASYLLGRAWGGRVGGLLTALLLGTSGVHVLVNSRVAWGNCITPLFTTLGAWLLYEALRSNPLAPCSAREKGAAADTLNTAPPSRRGKGAGGLGPPLLLAGLCWGLAFQTHPSVIALLPGVAAYVLWRGWPLSRTRWPYLALGLFLLANLNLLIFNLGTGLGSVSEAIGKVGAYQESISDRFEEGSDAQGVGGYLLRLGWLLTGLTLTLGGAVDGEEKQLRSLLEPALWPIAALALAGLFLQWRRGNPLPVLLLISAALVLPLFNGKYDPVFNGRYLMPLVPVLFASAASLLSGPLMGLRPTKVGRHVVRAGLALVILFLAFHPLSYLAAYTARELDRGRTNVRYFDLLDSLHRARAGRPVILDSSLQQAESPGGGTAYKTVSLALALGGVPYRLLDLERVDQLDSATRCQDHLALFWVGFETSGRSPEELRSLADRLGLREPDGDRLGRVRAGSFAILRLDRTPLPAPACR